MFCRFVLLAALLSFVPGLATAQEYVAPTWPNLVQALVRMRAIDLSDPVLLDEYGLITECDLYETFYSDDFKWNKVRNALRKSIKNSVATFPTRFAHDIEAQLDRYDFDTKTFLFTEKSRSKNDNFIPLMSFKKYQCDVERVQNLPHDFGAIIRPPLYLDGLPMSERDAKILIVRMERTKNVDRIIHARYNLRIVYIEPFKKENDANGGARYQQGGNRFMTVKMDAQLDSIDYYEDPKHTRLIYHLQM